MTRATMRLLCLVAALTGNPLRQAEAAEDLAHSLGELAQPYSIEEKDGGVGDDSGSSILRAGHHHGAAVASDATPALDTIGLAVEVGGKVSATVLRGEAVHVAVAATVARHAWLQRFLF